MILYCIIRRSSSSFSSIRLALNVLLLITVAWVTPARAQFKSGRDRKIVADILKTFQKECVQKGSTDGEIIKRIEGENAQARHEKGLEVQKCFESNYSQIVGVYYLYTKLCSDVAFNPPQVPDSLAARQVLEVNKYHSGIRPFHSQLNDCLSSLPDKKGVGFVVSLSGTELDAATMQKQIDDIRVRSPFAITGVPFR